MLAATGSVCAQSAESQVPGTHLAATQRVTDAPSASSRPLDDGAPGSVDVESRKLASSRSQPGRCAFGAGAPGSHFRLFDVCAARAGTALDVTYISARRLDRSDPRSGLELGLSSRLTWSRGAFYVTSSQATALRALNASSISLSLLQNGGHAGVRLGPLDVGAGIALSLFSVDYLEHDLSFGMFSPRALAFAGLGIGPVRLGVTAHTEYYFRWFGRDYIIRGLGVSLEFLGR